MRLTMFDRDPIVLVTGLADGAHVTALRAMADASARSGSLLLAAAPEVEARAECLDLTAILDEHAFIEACRHAAPEQLVLVRDHQLGFERMAGALADRGLRCVVLDANISYEVDPSWVESRLAELTAQARVELWALDLFCDVERAWDFLLHQTQEGEFGEADLRE